ncbi:hypothetical protein GAO09_28290 [Rhizobiales bacterium RZME27]|jgi:hypothetical protein|uniref:Uncharacterized protein n=1 Tax=Endobacterium cereale TaxID=2663029 RepID=A0A6A8AFQ0_9HYPH|nr:hypothetical protein [Endobacterium cereale]MEB2844673.1 hypothetical protein [Endobacterium cereale]MQY49932.1 hypothetical protein [Endobacterium cereale]
MFTTSQNRAARTVTPAEKPGQFRNRDNLASMRDNGSKAPENPFKTAEVKKPYRD